MLCYCERMNILIRGFHGCPQVLSDELNKFATEIKTPEGLYYKMCDTTLDEFMAKWKKPFQLHPIKAEDAAESYFCDYLVFVSDKRHFHVC